MSDVKALYEIILKSSAAYIRESHAIEMEGTHWNVSTLKDKFSFESIVDNKVRVPVFQDHLNIFYNTEDFYSRANQDSFQKDILIITDNITSQAFFFNITDRKTFQQFEEVKTDFLFTNSLHYFQTLDLLQKHEHKEDNLFYFVDSFSPTLRKVMFSSLNKEGKMTIKFPVGIPMLSRTISYKTRCEELRQSLENSDRTFPKFIKAELCKSLANDQSEKRIISFFEKLQDILHTAQQNYELYVSGITLDKFKTDYVEYKEKFFSQIRDILGKISTQVIALPLSITAATFATYRVNDKLPLFLLVVISFLLFSCYSFFLIRLYKNDVDEIKVKFDRDYDKLTKEDFFIRHQTELVPFELVRESITQRVRNIRKLVNVYVILLAVVNSMFIYFSLSQIKMVGTINWTVSIVSLLLFMILLYYLFWKKPEKEGSDTTKAKVE